MTDAHRAATKIADLIKAEDEAHHLHPYQFDKVCVADGYVARDGDYCERITGHEGDHGAYLCGHCAMGLTEDFQPKVWATEEGSNNG